MIYFLCFVCMKIHLNLDIFSIQNHYICENCIKINCMKTMNEKYLEFIQNVQQQKKLKWCK